MQIIKRIDPVAVKRNMDAVSERFGMKAMNALAQKAELDKDPQKMAAYLAQALSEDLEHLTGLRLPERPIIEVKAEESPLNTKFSGLFAKAREITDAWVAQTDDSELDSDERYTELLESFSMVVRAIKKDASSSIEASVALVELFNYLTTHEESNTTKGYLLSYNVVKELSSLPGVDPDVLDEVLLAYVPAEICGFNPFEFGEIGGESLKVLINRYKEDVNSGEPARVERAKAWADVLDCHEEINRLA